MAPLFKYAPLSGGDEEYATISKELDESILMLECYDVHKVTAGNGWHSDNLAYINRSTTPQILQAGHTKVGVAFLKFENEFQYMTPTQTWTIMRGGYELDLSSDISVEYF